MPRIVVHQHLYGPVSSRSSGEPSTAHGTLGFSEAEIPPEDLTLLERAARASLDPADATTAIKPVRKTFFQLPSGRFAVGRTQFATTQPASGPVRYVTHHHIVTREILDAHGGHPFSILDVAEWISSPEQIPHRIEPAWLQGPADPEILLSVLEPRRDLLGSLAAAVVARRNKPLMMVGDEKQGMDLLRVLFRVLPLSLRTELTFSSYFMEDADLGNLFSVVMTPRRTHAGNARDYILFDMSTGDLSPRIRPTAYGRWLSARLKSGAWERIDAFNRAVRAVQTRAWKEVEAFSPDGETFAALWDVAGSEAWRLVSGNPKQIADALTQISTPRRLADALLSTSPEILLGRDGPTEDVLRTLSVLRKSASRRAWSTWWDRWKETPPLASYVSMSRPWWRKIM